MNNDIFSKVEAKTIDVTISSADFRYIVLGSPNVSLSVPIIVIAPTQYKAVAVIKPSLILPLFTFIYLFLLFGK